MNQVSGGKYRVKYTRFGVQLYYPADTWEHACQWVRMYSEIGEGEIEITGVVTPTGSMVDIASIINHS